MQKSIFARSLEQGFRGLDWNFIKGSTLLSVGTVLSRVLGMAFSLVLARAFLPEEFGAVRYAITLGTIFSVATQPFGQHVLARFIGKYRDDAEQLRFILPNSLLILAVLFPLTFLVAVPVLLATGQFNVGVLSIILGVSCYYAYWGLCRGFGAQYRLIGVTVGSNIVQLAAVIFVIYVLDIRSPVLAMVIFGLSYFLPILAFQFLWPLPTRWRLADIRRHVIGEILRFSGSIWGSHVGYVIYNSVAVVFLERFAGTAAVGVYALANTLARSFLFVPEAISTLVMPMIASSARRSHAAMVKKLLLLSLAVNSGLLLVYLLAVRWFVVEVFGPEYFEGGIAIYAIMAVAMIVLGMHGVVTAVLVGQGKAGTETVSRLVALIATTLSAWFLVPQYGAAGAAVAMLVGAVSATGHYGYVLLRPKVKKHMSSLNVS